MNLKNIAKEVVDNHTTGEVVLMVTKGLKKAINNYDGNEDSAWAAGVFSANVIDAVVFLEALNEKLSPKDPVVA